MKLTPYQLRQNAAAMMALADGKPIQFFSNDAKWEDYSVADDGEPTDWHCYQYRPKPEPKTRPWSTPEDVPGPVCWIRGIYSDGHRDYRMSMIVGFSDPTSYQTISNGCQPIALSSQFSDTRWERMEYSTDRKTWHKCEVSE